jgi:uncharacterized membrane protein
MGRIGTDRAGVGLWIAAVLAIGVALASYRYLLPGMPGAPDNILANRFARDGALVVHATLASTALLLGALQFFPGLRNRFRGWHRRAGTAYVACCLLAGLAGLLLAFGSSSGPIATTGFGLLAVLWIVTTTQAWRYARARDFVRHRAWMTRSYALTFAAVTLRLYLPIVGVARLDFVEAYRAISWLCWVPNLIVAEWLVRRPGFRTTPRLATPSQSPG